MQSNNVLIITSSPTVGGNGDVIASIAANELTARGANASMLNLRNLDIQPIATGQDSVAHSDEPMMTFRNYSLRFTKLTPSSSSRPSITTILKRGSSPQSIVSTIRLPCATVMNEVRRNGLALSSLVKVPAPTGSNCWLTAP